MSELLFIVGLVSAAWYLAFAVGMSGPFQVFDKLREWRGGRWHGRTEEQFINGGKYDQGGMGIYNKDGLMDCLVCRMPYIALMLLIAHHFNLDLLYWPFSIAGLALWAHSTFGWTGRGK